MDILHTTVELGSKELFSCPKIFQDPYPYEVNGKLVTGYGSLIPICSLSNCSLLPGLTVLGMYRKEFQIGTIRFISLSFLHIFLGNCNFLAEVSFKVSKL